MSGLLRRLARRAIDREVPQVHAITRLPFAGGVPTEVPGDADTPEPVLMPDRVSDPTPVASPRSVADSVGGVPADDAPRTGEHMQRFAHTASEQGQAPEPPVSGHAHDRPPAPAAPAPGKQHADAVSHPTGAQGSADAAAPREVAPVRSAGRPAARLATDPDAAVMPEGATGDPTTGRNEVEQRRPAARRGSLSPTAVPEPLLGPVAPAPVVPAVPSRPHQGRQARAPGETRAPDAPNEVHVHIGRIEVTAVHEPATAKPKARAPGRQPMSLEDYLARRDRSLK